ncbi:hypothetical protein B0T17DRAFT_354820 [Bombardia bombarda]|uniref:Uncharacterized protein n=1 Tax=Bombardia bombarda TaxID=252184 RepID=A0AA39WI08_9PEZI|nr:hypothetical protein B0T17DRAFT_354820 [Bombardia bombarda]
MKCQSLSLLAACLASVMASLDFEDSIRHEFKMGAILPRQNVNNAFLTTPVGGIPIPPNLLAPSGDTQQPFKFEGKENLDANTAAEKVCSAQRDRCQEKAKDNNNNPPFSIADCEAQKV